MVGYAYIDLNDRVKLVAVGYVAPRSLPLFSSPEGGTRRASRLLGEAAWTCVVDNAKIGLLG